MFCVREPSVCGFQVCGEPSVCGSQVCVWCKGAKCVQEPIVWGTQVGGASKWLREPKVWGSQMCVVSKCSREPKVCEASSSPSPFFCKNVHVGVKRTCNLSDLQLILNNFEPICVKKNKPCLTYRGSLACTNFISTNFTSTNFQM